MDVLSKGRTILVGEDEGEVRGYLEIALNCMGYGVELAQDGEEVIACLEAAPKAYSAVLLDVMMPNKDGIETLREIRAMQPDLPVIIISGASAPMNIVTAMKCGATDFLCKPVAHEDLSEAVARTLEGRPVEDLHPLRKTEQITKSFVGKDAQMRELHTLVGQIGWSEAPVLIQGKTGSGKEVLARELHAQSPRAHKRFLKLNCAALPSELVESELFGYERGAFTGAFQKKAGMFEQADGGTILLDEIGDMDVSLQAKLLQVLQDQEFQRIGGKEPIKVDVRVMAATHRDLEEAIQDRTFREDLYYRLNVINLVVPSLCERKDDIIPLAEFLLAKHTPPGMQAPLITSELRLALLRYRWPGNVRELENYMRKLIILRNPDLIARELHAKSLGKRMVAGALEAGTSEVNEKAPILEQVTKAGQHAEAEAIVAALDSTRWNRKQAAALLNIDYKALLYKMKKLGVENRTARSGDASGRKMAITV